MANCCNCKRWVSSKLSFRAMLDKKRATFCDPVCFAEYESDLLHANRITKLVLPMWKDFAPWYVNKVPEWDIQYAKASYKRIRRQANLISKDLERK